MEKLLCKGALVILMVQYAVQRLVSVTCYATFSQVYYYIALYLVSKNLLSVSYSKSTIRRHSQCDSLG